MSSQILARAAFRSATAASRAPAARRQFSVINSLRSFARSFEPHPFERLPVANNAQAADWGRQVKRIAQQGVLCVLFFVSPLSDHWLGERSIC
ncbi:hypothetical protein QBC47DRAFT_367510 [Echria macrotheca]|uniref:Uncharacterized protein n=1 Tax=Echria macrotheca TaxID=438768 RepID=A0AAJ0BNP6_9PEZI|nr:hypothetical protein QBC47DRAFT_367510 [Echria macrotheca]